jgi:Invasion protein B family
MSNLKSVLVDALGILGIDAGQFSFDDKSLIALNFRDIGDVLLNPLDDAVWLWGSLAEMPSDALRSPSFDLLMALAEPAPYLASDCLCFRGAAPDWRVGGPLRSECVTQPDHMAAAIEMFYLRVSELREMTR